MSRPCVVTNLFLPVPGPTLHGPKGSLCLLGTGQGLGWHRARQDPKASRQQSGCIYLYLS